MSGEKPKSSSRDSVILGVDILAGSSSFSSKQPHYAAVFIKGDKVIDEYEDASLSRLIRLIWERRPKIIAIDNIYELAPSEDKLVKLMSLLPPDIELIQVTGWGPQAVNMKAIARSLGLEVHGKLTPIKTAYIAAVAAGKGYGYKIRFIEEKTKIVVSRGRGLKRGGMSHNRYVRSIRAGILRMTKEIKSILDKHGLDYDLVFRKSRGGLERSIFIVYAPRSKLYGLVKPLNTKTVRVEIKPVYTSKIKPIALDKNKSSRKPVIIGLDPGINTGLAVVDVNGVPLLLHSSKNIDRSDIISMIASIGVPVIVATDVASPPDSVKKLAASLNAIIYTPPRDLSNDEKNLIVYNVKKRYPWIDVENTHERDALAAAYKAYLSYEDKFKQLETQIEDIDLPIDIDNIKAMIIRGKSMAEALEEEVSKLLMSEKPIEHYKRDGESTQQPSPTLGSNERIRELTKKIKLLEAENRALKRVNKELQNRIEELEVEIRNLRYAIEPDEDMKRLIDMLAAENKRLSNEIKMLKQTLEERDKKIRELQRLLREIVDKGFIPIPIVGRLCLHHVSRINLDNLKVKALYIGDLSSYDSDSLNYLRRNRVAVIADISSENKILENMIPVLDLKKYQHYIIGDRVYIEPNIVVDIEALWKKIDEVEKEKSFEKILKLISEYKRERKKKLGVNIDQISRNYTILV